MVYTARTIIGTTYEAMELDDGELVVPDRPGTGFTFDDDARRRYSA